MPRSPAFLRAGFSFFVRRDARAPKPPASFNVLSDWDPAYSLYADRVAPISYSPVGTAPTREKVDGIWCGVFGGAGALEGSGAPFAALADLTGGVSIYVVAERTDAAATQLGLVSIDEADGVGTPNVNTILIAWNGNNAPAALSYDPAGGVTLDTGGTLTRDTPQIVSGHVTLTQRDARVGGVGVAETSGTTRAPADLDRLVIGGSALFQTTGLGQFFTGRLRRKLTCEGPYNAAVLTYIQGLY